ncbi:soluble quino protein glucose dehydrogenase [Dendrothele bispora CBS 962.96]|uniref:Soluble quino protein glucose dehydrogenase n=1 Tax=Dendrothele bispora (strain CBS 962.96) TaxID=1314807 RepID=A0A4S8LS52_DENBC|nr:soluble quino protein glucose dehydrogenase [Dendrothele bispora CBS 962.96]
MRLDLTATRGLAFYGVFGIIHTYFIPTMQSKLGFILVTLSLFLQVAFAQVQPPGVPFRSPVTVAPGYSAHVIFSNLTTPRGIAFDSTGSTVLVVERGFGLTALSPSSTSPGSWERSVVVQNTGFTHGIQVDGSSLYLSTGAAVLLYQYDAQTKTVAPNQAPMTLISGLPADGELTTHTLQLEKDHSGKVTALLVGNGPLTNIDTTARDPASGRSQIRRFSLPSSSSTTQTWSSGQIIAYGIRNPAGLAFDPSTSVPKLYVVENGASIDNVTGLTAQFVNDNPADEMELVTFGSSILPFYGFPDCTTLWNPQADPVGNPEFVNLPRGTQFSLRLDPTRDDPWCQDEKNNLKPALSFQAHSVPLDIKFYEPSGTGSGSFPSSSAGDAFVSFHGSFDRDPPTGYGVVQVPFPLATTPSSGLGYSFLIQATNLNTCPGTCIRPVGLSFGADGKLYVSSDSSGEIFVIEQST